MRNSILSFFVVLGVLLVLVDSHSIPLRKQENVFYKHSELTDMERARFISSGSIPMTGGLLVIGTYVGTLSVGTPSFDVEMLIDTGSSNTGIPLVNCDSCSSSIPGFDPLTSSTFEPMDCNSDACRQCSPLTSSCTECSDFFGDSVCSSKTPSACGFGITYGGGGSALQGYYAYDVACFGDMCTTVTLSMIENEFPSNSMTTSGSSSTGILGLASEYNACNPTCISPIFDSYVESGMTSNLFSICLTPSDGGVLDIGFIDDNKYTGQLQYAPMSFDRWYDLNLLDIQVGGNTIDIPSFIYGTTNDEIGTFIDSGTASILMNMMSFNAFKSTFQRNYGHIHGVSGLFSGSTCILKSGVQLGDFPDVTFVIQSQDDTPLQLSVPPSAYLLDTGRFYCMGIGGISSVGVVLGDVFMQNFYIVHDRANLQIGFAPLNPGTCTA